MGHPGLAAPGICIYHVSVPPPLGNLVLGMEQMPPKAVLPEQGIATGGLAGMRCVPESTTCRIGVLHRAQGEVSSPEWGLRCSQETLISSSTFSMMV